MANDQLEVVIAGDDLTGWSATLPTGQVYKGKSQAELLNEVVKAQVHSSMTISQKEQELQQTRTQLQETERQTQEQRDRIRRAAGDGRNDDDAVFDKNAFNTKYWELINTDPYAAMQLANSVYFGMDNPQAAFQKNVIVAELVSDAAATREFLKDNEDFPATPQNSERVLDELLNRKMDVTSYNLQRVWTDLKREGSIKPLSREEIEAEQTQLTGGVMETTTRTGGRRQPPPAGPNTNTNDDDASQKAQLEQDQFLNNFASMSRADRENYLKKQGLM